MAAVADVLHILHANQFAEPFIDFLETAEPGCERQLFFCIDTQGRCGVRRRPNVIFASDSGGALSRRWFLLRQLYGAQKVFLHGLWGAWILRMLAVQPWLLAKCYWIIWGADLYAARLAKRDLPWYLHELPRRLVIRRIGHLVSYIDGDVALARDWYRACGEHHRCLMYPSNTFKDLAVPASNDDTTHIQVGNSADPENDHLAVFAHLERFRNEDIRIYAPLSYGDCDYAARVAAAGRDRFGERFEAMTNFLPLVDYLEFLRKIDIAIFNHRRQQAMGNVITLLGLGKKVYLSGGTTSRAMLEGAGIGVHDLENFSLEPIDPKTAARNREAVRTGFSIDVLRTQWAALLS